MNIKSYLAAAALCMLPLLSHAGVVYKWQGLNDDTPWGLTLELEFDKRTVNSGSLRLLHTLEVDGPVPKRGLLNLRYSYLGNSDPMLYSAKDGGFPFERGSVFLDLKFDSEGFLTGEIFAADDMYNGFSMASDSRVFMVTNAFAEGHGMEGAGCVFREPCFGAKGYIRQVGEVPEPASIALLALGAAGLASTRRRKAAR